MNYDNICFVVMPFGSKSTKGRIIDFDYIYSEIFEPAISTVQLPEGGLLEPRRSDNDLFAGDISNEMFLNLEYSRLVFTDITSLNPNVFYELGHRHRARQSGTVIFRLADQPIPFDITQTKCFPYEYEPEEHAQQSRDLIRQVLTESLERNRLDSPIRLILKAQQHNPNGINSILQEAENALRNADPIAAINHYKEAVELSPENARLHLSLGILYKGQGKWDDALKHFNQATTFQTKYSEAWRERGVAENKIFCASNSDVLPSGEDSIRKALSIDPKDFDALSSLGGILKRKGNLEEAKECYLKAATISNGNSYPLLNAIKLDAQLSADFKISAKEKFLLKRAKQSLEAQTSNTPPYNAPWSHFDLTEICLFLGEPEQSYEVANKGLMFAQQWHAKTFGDSLSPLTQLDLDLPGLEDLLELINETQEYLS